MARDPWEAMVLLRLDAKWPRTGLGHVDEGEDEHPVAGGVDVADNEAVRGRIAVERAIKLKHQSDLERSKPKSRSPWIAVRRSKPN